MTKGKYPKLKLLTKKQLKKLAEIHGLDFIVDYSYKRDSVYNRLIDRLNFLEKAIDETINLCNIVLENEPMQNNPNEDLLDHITGIKKELTKGDK
ncbi:MAG: hypothetical protein NC483_00635 [Ruminococcus sp.]|nr:hypothetical protein [Ruminococcus sp.]